MKTRIRLVFTLLFILFGGMFALSEILELTIGATIIPAQAMCQALSGKPCSTVASQSFRFPLGMPLPFIALAYYLLGLMLFPWSGFLPERSARHFMEGAAWPGRFWALVGALFAGVGLAFCQWGIRANSSYFLLTWLPAFAAFLLFLPGIDSGSWRRSVRQVFTADRLLRPLLSLLGVLLLLAVGASYYWKTLSTQLTDADLSIPELYQAWKAAPKIFIPIPPKAIELGLLPSEIRPDAPVLHVIEFFDLECQPCLESLSAVVPLPDSLRRRIRYTLIHFPLSVECNPDIPGRIHPLACNLALQTLAQDNPGAIDLVRRRVTYPAEAPQALLGRVPEIRHAETLARHVEAGRAIGIKSTPAIYVNGKLLPRLKKGKNLPRLLKHIEQRETPAKPMARIVGSAAGLNRVPLLPIGNPDSAVEIIEISSYECPFSKEMGQALNELMEKRSVALVHKSALLVDKAGYEFVSRLWIALNHLALTRPDPEERRLFAETCVFFRNWQYRLAGRDVVAMQKAVNLKMKERGVDLALLKAAYNEQTNQILFGRNLGDLQALQVKRTPTVYLNGKIYEGEPKLKALEAFLDQGKLR